MRNKLMIKLKILMVMRQRLSKFVIKLIRKWLITSRKYQFKKIKPKFKLLKITIKTLFQTKMNLVKTKQ